MVSPNYSLSLGTIVSFNSPKQVSFEALKTGLDYADLDENLAREILPHNAFRRACRSLSKNRVIDVVKDEPDKMTFQFTKKEHQDNRVDFNHERDVVVDKKTGVVSTSSFEFEQQAQDLLNKELRTRHGADVTRLVHKVFDSKGGDLIKIRPQGGAYFVPQSHAHLVDKIRRFMEYIGGVLVSYEIGGESETTRESIAQNMYDHFQSLLKEFHESCEELSEDASDAVKQRRQQTVEALKTKLQAYQGLMGDFSKDIKEGITKAEAEMNAKLFAAFMEDDDNDEDEPEPQAETGGADDGEPVEVTVEANAVHEEIDVDSLFNSIL